LSKEENLQNAFDNLLEHGRVYHSNYMLSVDQSWINYKFFVPLQLQL